jgi:hypothetical protein
MRASPTMSASLRMTRSPSNSPLRVNEKSSSAHTSARDSPRTHSA